MKTRTAGGVAGQGAARVAATFQQALEWQQRGDLTRADAVCAELLHLQPSHADGWHLRGLLALQSGQYERGAALIGQSLVLNPRQPAAEANLGTALLQSKRADQALEHFERALALGPHSAATLYGRGSALLLLERFDAALADFDRVLTLVPDLVPALCARGQTLQQLQQPAAALACLQRAAKLAPYEAEVLYHQGNVLFDLKRHEAALASYDEAAAAGLTSVDLFNNRGNALRELFRHEEALASYQRALTLDPAHPETLSNQGNAFLDLNRLPEALACYDAALQAQPDCTVALDNRGLALSMADRPEEAAQSYARLLEIAPHYKAKLSNWLNVLCNLLNARCTSCDWQTYGEDRATILESVAQGSLLHPFPFLAVSESAALQLGCARRFAADKWGGTPPSAWTGTLRRHERLRVAYLSADLREHVVSFLMAGVFEQHDRDRFETIAISLRPAQDSATGRRVRAAFARFIEISGESDREVAELLRKLEVDVVVDLMGFTRGCRPGIFAHRAAPVQVNYLGYPGTMGAPFIDYILADEFVIPPQSRQHYAEQVVYLPECFQANDDRRVIGVPPTRAQAGLPGQGLVLCCFNNNYKLSPPLFAVWMRVLQATPGSVLWLLGDRDGTQENLRREARAHGVEAERLVFAGRMGYTEHLGRLGLADLFLDTVPYNAGATASDALRTGVPVLTCVGEAFAARMAGSLLKTVGLPELITCSLEEYEGKALELARQPQALQELRARLARNLTGSPLFDTARFTRHLETAYLTMHQRASNGHPAAAFSVRAQASRTDSQPATA